MKHISTTAVARFAALLLAALLLLAACGTSAPTGGASGDANNASTDVAAPATAGATSSTLDACALITQDEAAAALGQAAKAPQHGAIEHAGDSTSASVSTCSYDAADADSLASVGLLVRRAPTDENTPAAISSVRETVKGLGSGDPQDVPDLGDSAFWGAHQLHVFTGGRLYLIVSMFGMKEDPGALAKAQQVAKLALGRL